MTSLAIWDFRQPKNLNIATTNRSFTFRDFLAKQYGERGYVSGEVKSLFEQAKKMFNINSIDEAFDYLESRASDELKGLFPLITRSIFLTQNQVDEIKLIIDGYLIEVYPKSRNNGINECLALYMLGLYELNFDTTLEYIYKGLFNIAGSVVPFLNGKIQPTESQEFEDELDYKDRVLFSIIIHEVVTNLKVSANNSRIFKSGFSSELGNVLCHSTELFGIASRNEYYNYMRILLDPPSAHIQSQYIGDSLDFNMFYTLNTKSLEQAANDDSTIDIAEQFDKYFKQILENLCTAKLSVSVTGIDSAVNVTRQFLCKLYKDFLYIQSLMQKYLPEIQLKALRRQYIDVAYLILRNTLQEVIYRTMKLEHIEIVLYEIASHLETLVLEEYGAQNKYNHLLFCFKELDSAVNDPTKYSKLQDHFYWFMTPNILNNKNALLAFETAANAGSISAKMNLSLCYYMNNKNTAVYKAKAAKSELELMELGAPTLSLGVSLDVDEALYDNADLPGFNKDIAMEYLLKKQDNYDFSRPDMIVHTRDFYKKKILDEIDEKVRTGESVDVEEMSSEKALVYFINFANKFPFVKNTMKMVSFGTEITAVWSIAAESGCSLSSYYLLADSEGVDISPFPFEFEDLTNPDLTGYLLNPSNWNRYGLIVDQMEYVKGSIGQTVINQTYDSCDRAMEVFSKYENHIGEILQSGKLPSIEQVGIFINMYMCLMSLAHFIVMLPYTGNKVRHKELSENLHKFLVDRSVLDWRVIGHTRLADIFTSRTGSNTLKRMVDMFAESRFRPNIDNILALPSLSVKWSDSLSDYMPKYDSPLGVVFAQYIQWCTQTLQAACKVDNHLDSTTSRLWSTWIYSLTFLHANCFYDVEHHIVKANMSREHIPHKTLGMNQHKKFVETLRRFMKNTIPLNVCIEELTYLIKRGSVGAAEIYHAMLHSALPGRRDYFPHNTALLIRAASSIAQTESIQFITPNVRSVMAPYMMLVLLLRHSEGQVATLETREFILNSLVRHKDAMGLVFNAYSAYHSENKISSTGHTLEQAVALVRENATAHRHIIQLLGVKLDDLTIKFPQAKMKYKLSEITPHQWLDAFVRSGEYFKF